MNKMEDLINMTKLNELLNKKEEVEEKKTSKVVWIFAIIGILICLVASIVINEKILRRIDELEDLQMLEILFYITVFSFFGAMVFSAYRTITHTKKHIQIDKKGTL